MKPIFSFLAIIVGILLLAGNAYVEKGNYFVHPQVIAAVPAQPFACDATQRARLIYVDDTNDTAEAFLCFCGTDADDTTYRWLKVNDPATNCF